MAARKNTQEQAALVAELTAESEAHELAHERHEREDGLADALFAPMLTELAKVSAVNDVLNISTKEQHIEGLQAVAVRLKAARSALTAAQATEAEAGASRVAAAAAYGDARQAHEGVMGGDGMEAYSKLPMDLDLPVASPGTMPCAQPEQ